MGRAVPGAILNSNDWFRFCLLLPSGSAYLPRFDHGLFWGESERDGAKRELVTSFTLFSKKKLSRPEESHNITSMDLCTLILDPSSGFFDGVNRLTVCNVIREKRVSLQEYAAQKKLRAVFSLQNCKGKGNRKGVSLNLQYLFFFATPDFVLDSENGKRRFPSRSFSSDGPTICE